MIMEALMTSEPCQACGHSPSVEYKMAPKGKCSSGKIIARYCGCCISEMQGQINHAQKEAVRVAMLEVV